MSSWRDALLSAGTTLPLPTNIVLCQNVRRAPRLVAGGGGLLTDWFRNVVFQNNEGTAVWNKVCEPLKSSSGR
jgi:hypothetical protein